MRAVSRLASLEALPNKRLKLRRQVMPWATRLFGSPDSVRNRDSTGTIQGEGEFHARITTAYWTGTGQRRWSAEASVLKVARPDGIGPGGAVIGLHCKSRFGQTRATCE